ncbi:MAG: molecular chaperone HtpG [Desulfovibrionaceae bacterium]|nr:molecular chaperone HtpG [Desulfovibrionaceae bacterium]MBF0515035.1 molecular chaperone HtpG [Desulfovibrionaceae bacterium]
MSAPSSHEFKAEIKQLLDIITHSLYTNKEIFLRELISNASDALDKMRFLAAKGETAKDPGLPLEIRIELDKQASVLRIADTGLGMTEGDLIEHIGTIAKSGTADFIKSAGEQGGAGNIIGRFGVGFYSVFMAAKDVVITTRSYRPDAKAVVWRSDGLGGYEITEGPADAPRGTVIEARLREGEQEFADKDRIVSIIKHHSQFVSFPIFVDGEKVNTIAALWREPKSQVAAEQYDEFYKFMTFDNDSPLAALHLAVDAPVQFSSLLFIPAKSQENFFGNREEWGPDLYARRVLINRQNKDLLPQYLSFVKGVVDTEDLPLNVSRETLQENRVVRKINQTLVKDVLAKLAALAAQEPEKYKTFWQAHGKIFKYACNDYSNREKVAPLMRFNSSFDADAAGLTSFDDYIARAKPEQKDIYFLSAPGREAAAVSPHLEIFRQKGLEVLYLYEPIDEFVMDAVGVYKEFKLTAAEQADLGALEKFASAETAEKLPELGKDEQSAFDGLLVKIKAVLGERVSEVRASKRLSGSPACLAAKDGAASSSMEKIMRLIGKDESIPVKVLEINRDHKLVRNMIKIFKSDPGDAFLVQTAEQLFEASLLQDGYLADPHKLVGNLSDLLEKSSGWYAQIKGL